MSNLEISRAERLDHRVVKQLPGITRSFAARLIEDGKVTVNGVAATKAGYKLRPDDLVRIDYNHDEMPEIADIDLPIVYEDEDCVVINKPAGVLSHSKGAFNPEATVASWLSRRASTMSGERAGIVHRLDRATSGLMICAKTPAALAWLQKQFAKRNVKKTYVAVVQGSMSEKQAVIDMPIERNPHKPQTFRVGSNGKPALTEYRVLLEHDGLSLVELRPQTGRTHQLRVHLAKLGHPIIGDTLYGGQTSDRLYLHAEALELTLPSRERRRFEAKTPSSFRKVAKP